MSDDRYSAAFYMRQVSFNVRSGIFFKCLIAERVTCADVMDEAEEFYIRVIGWPERYQVALGSSCDPTPRG